MKPYSCDFREKIIAAYRNGQGSLRKVAKQFSVSTATVWLLWQRYLATGSVNPKPHTGGRDSVMTPYRLEVLRGLVKEKNDSTLEELRDKFHEATGLRMSCGTISMALKKLGLPRKKKTFHAAEREGNPDVAEEREAYLGGMPAMDVQHLVFADEFGVNLGMAREYARAEPGRRAEGHRPCNRGSNVTVIAGLSTRGILAPFMFPGGVNGEIFKAYVGKVLLPELGPGYTLLIDNVPSHKVEGIEAMVKNAHVKLQFLPRYSPDLSPMENAISKIKERLRGIAAREYEALVDAVRQAITEVSPGNAQGWFKGCGYSIVGLDNNPKNLS